MEDALVCIEGQSMTRSVPDDVCSVKEEKTKRKKIKEKLCTFDSFKGRRGKKTKNILMDY